MPGRCGVSDQAVVLARELNAACGIDSAFVVVNSDERGNVPFASIYSPATKLLESCVELAQGRTAAVLLQVSGYGYSPDGAPTILADGLEKLKASGRFRTAAYFHETFAVGPPWKSAFWYMHRQKQALRRIISRCGLIVTNIMRHAEWLERESRRLGGVAVERMPVFSPAGGADALAPFAQRSAAMVVFGLHLHRELSYRKLAAAGSLLGSLGIQEILDIGPQCNHPAEVNGVRVKRMGLLPAEDLPTVFSQARFGFVSHPWYCLAKSSVFAAYCAQGTIPVLTGPFPGKADGLRDGVQVVTPQTVQAVRNSGWDVCSRAAWTWYMTHSVRVHAERYAKWMRGIAESERGISASDGAGLTAASVLDR
jgi:hypothetical protein